MQKTEIIKVDSQNPNSELIKKAADILLQGGLVAFPTETVYGLAALISNRQAINRLRKLKERPQEKKFSICIHDLSQVEQFVDEPSPFAYKLMRKFWPGPLTLVLKAKDSDTVGLRMPDHNVALALLKQTGIPIFAPSANLSGHEPPICAEDVLVNFAGKIEAVIDSGRTQLSVVSTVCAVINGDYRILRAGAIPESMIMDITKFKNILFVCTGNSCRSPMAEGLLKKMLGNDKYIKVESAGVATFDGMPATKETIAVLEKEGIIISDHRSRRLTDEMIKESDLILVMESYQKQHILNRVLSAEKRIFLLREFDNEYSGDLNIPDPIGAQIDVYERVFKIIKNAVERLVLKL